MMSFARQKDLWLRRVYLTLPLLWMTLVSCHRGASAVAPDCCPPGAVWDASVNCTDGSRINLNCSYGFYKVDPDANFSDNFTVVERRNGLWLIEGYGEVPPESFCLTSSKKTGNQLALVCFDTVDESPSRWRFDFFGILIIISSIFLVITLLVYAVLPELRDIQDKSMMAAVLSLTVGYILLATEQFRPHDEDEEDTICVPLAFTMYFAFVSAFFWINLVSFNVWRSVWFKNFIVKEKILFIIFCIIGWGGPLCFLVAALTTHHTDGYHLKPRFGENTCWFAGDLETWVYFYGPIAVLLSLNIVYLTLTSWRLWHEYRDYNGSKLRALRFKCLLYIKLVLVMGITWIFEVISFATGPKHEIFWGATDIFNRLQGVVIFILLVASRKRVRKLLAKKQPFGIAFPKSWAAYDDEECEAVLPEEVELSQSN